jgi:hypothetical protein
VLARLDKIANVQQSLANRPGTMIRVTVNAAADKDKVAEDVLKVLTQEKRKPVRLTGEEFEQALRNEQWRDLEHVGELSAIEFRTLTLRRIKAFAEKEGLNKETTDKLVKISAEQLDRIAKAANPEKSDQLAGISQWLARYKEFARSVPDRAKDFLSADQVERLRQALASPWGRQKEKGQRP